jgi:hypothetical protein
MKEGGYLEKLNLDGRISKCIFKKLDRGCGFIFLRIGTSGMFL